MLSENSTFENFIKTAKDKHIVGFGASHNIARISEILSAYDVAIEYIVDNDFWKWGSDICGIPIQSPTKLVQESAESFVVLICIDSPFAIEKQLLDMGISNCYAFNFWVDLIYKHNGNGVVVKFF